ncbi:MAG: hypothetical protein WCG31_09175 [Deltaproteobacteria bacterium]
MQVEPLKRKLSASMLKLMENDSQFVKHEWKELVEKLSSSDDPNLRFIGFQESETIRSKEKVAKES